MTDEFMTKDRINKEPFGLSEQDAELILKDIRLRALIEIIVEDIEQYFEVNQFEIQPSDEG